jgi:hypothetical protein
MLTSVQKKGHNFELTCLNGYKGVNMPSTDPSRETKDIHVLQLLTRLVRETDRLVRLADDIDTNATTPQAKAAFNLIGSEVNGILGTLKNSLEPLYRLYDLDPGMRQLSENRRNAEIKSGGLADGTDEDYDQKALWAEVKEKS